MKNAPWRSSIVLHVEYNRVSRATRGSLISSRNNRVRQIRSDGSHPRNRPISLVPWTSCRPSPTSIVPDLSSMVHFYGTTTPNGVSSTCFYTIAQVMWELLHFCPRFVSNQNKVGVGSTREIFITMKNERKYNIMKIRNRMSNYIRRSKIFYRWIIVCSRLFYPVLRRDCLIVRHILYVKLFSLNEVFQLLF